MSRCIEGVAYNSSHILFFVTSHGPRNVEWLSRNLGSILSKIRTLQLETSRSASVSDQKNSMLTRGIKINATAPQKLGRKYKATISTTSWKPSTLSPTQINSHGQGSMMLWKNFFPLPVLPLGSSQVFPDGYAGKGPPSESFSSLDAQQNG